MLRSLHYISTIAKVQIKKQQQQQIARINKEIKTNYAKEKLMKAKITKKINADAVNNCKT